MGRIKIIIFWVIILEMFTVTSGFGDTKSLEGIIRYTPIEDTKSVYGVLNCRGSTNVGDLLTKWLPAFQHYYPEVESNLDFKGSSDGIKGLIAETANVGATSRPIKKRELEEFRALKGYFPTEIKVSLDALAIYVNRLNKLETITLDELDAVFSSTLKREYSKSILTWLPLTGMESNLTIYLFNKDSGARSYFRDKVMLKGEYNMDNVVSDEYTLLSQVINKVANDKDGISFGSVGAKNFKVKTVALAKRKYFPAYYPSEKEIKAGNYPLTRFLYIYLDVPPDKAIPKLLYEFCKFILSYDGQATVVREGKLPLSPKLIGIELSKLRRGE